MNKNLHLLKLSAAFILTVSTKKSPEKILILRTTDKVNIKTFFKSTFWIIFSYKILWVINLFNVWQLYSLKASLRCTTKPKQSQASRKNLCCRFFQRSLYCGALLWHASLVFVSHFLPTTFKVK